jgi:glycosyltransferase involved in cell wall biosynthesis
VRILALSFFPAFVPPSNGGEARLFHFYQALSRWFDVTLLSSTFFGGEEQLIQHGPSFKERRIPKDEYFGREWAKLQKHAADGDLSAPCLAACAAYPTKIHLAYLEEYPSADIIIHESPFLVGCDIFAGLDNKCRIYNSHNAEADLYSQLHRHQGSQGIRDIVREAEKHLLQQVNMVCCCNTSDLSSFRELAPACQYETLHVPHGAQPRRGEPRRARKALSRLQCVFMGSGHPPNVEAARFIVESLAPKCPSADFTIVGTCFKEGTYGRNVRCLGKVSDSVKADVLSSVDLALNPMASGSGSNVKVLDYFAYGLPLISTNFGMRGIEATNGKHFIESPLDGFAQEINTATTRLKELRAIGVSARDFVADLYSWDSIAEKAATRITQLAETCKSAPKKQVLLVLNDYNSFTGVGGGCTRTRGLYEQACVWHDVVFLCFSALDRLCKTQISEGITVIEIPMTKEHAKELADVNSLHHVAADDIIAGRQCLLNPVLLRIYENLRKNAHLVIVEHCYLSPVPYSYRDGFVYSSQNHELELKKESLCHHPLGNELTRDVALLEDIAVRNALCSVAVSVGDAETLLRGRNAAGPVLVIPNGAADPPEVAEVDQSRRALTREIDEKSVVFVGSAHMPNVEGAAFICTKLAPSLPKLQFHIIGSVCRSVIDKPRNVTLWDVVSEATKSAILQSSALAINPMASGGGSNIKLSDYMAHGLLTVSTSFGARGYEGLASKDLRIAKLEEFQRGIAQALDDPRSCAPDARQSRRKFFDEHLSMAKNGQLFTDVLKNVGKKKRKVLFVTYRFTWPLQGGAETYLEQLLRALGESGQFDIDVVATEVSSVSEYMRFASDYRFDPACSAPAMIPNLRYARFAVDRVNTHHRVQQLKEMWATQPLFEKKLHQIIEPPQDVGGLAWGWADPEDVGGGACARWALADCGLQLAAPCEIRIKGFAPNETVLTAFQNGVQLADSWVVRGSFDLVFSAEKGTLEVFSSAPALAEDPRPISFFVTKLEIAGSVLDLSKPMLWQQEIVKLQPSEAFSRLDHAAQETRGKRGIRLSDVRGPASSELESFISNHVSEYDLVVTHNSVFRPAVVAIEEAKKAGVPSILLPHLHLDDDFYHFPDILECARQADLVLASPKAAVEFLNQRGCRSEYHSPGIDTGEEFSAEDRNAFRAIYSDTRPFVLILGRKAGAKRYQDIVAAVEELNAAGIDMRAVLIGPDDDKQPILSRFATYLGPQPRDVARGALMSCFALCNMSASESFGIVLLEAWLTSKPVIANKNCAAFHDLAENEVDALLVDFSELSGAIANLFQDHDLRRRLGVNGRRKCDSYGWQKTKEEFIQYCLRSTEQPY